MTPANLEGCWHACCHRSLVHDHEVTPEDCEACGVLEDPSPVAVAARERALGIAASKFDKPPPGEQGREQ